MLVVQSVQSSKSHDQCHFYLGGKIAFSIKVRDRLLTEPWLLLQSPRPCIFFFLNHPATHKPTNLCTGTHTNENTLSLPMCTKAYSHIKSTKFTLTGLSHKENISPLYPLCEETLTNNCGFKLFPLEGAFTH